ncbi:hypothetical protein R4J17_04940 [Brachyspira intermedia]
MINLPPTLLKMANIKYQNMDEKSIQDIIEDKNYQNVVFLQISESFVGRAIRTEDYSYCIYDPDKNPIKDKDSLTYKSYSLYDLKKDPYQLNNVVNDESYNDVKIQLKNIIKEKIMTIEKLDVKID